MRKQLPDKRQLFSDAGVISTNICDLTEPSTSLWLTLMQQSACFGFGLHSTATCWNGGVVWLLFIIICTKVSLRLLKVKKMKENERLQEPLSSMETDKIFSNLYKEDWPQGGALLNKTNFKHIVNYSPWTIVRFALFSIPLWRNSRIYGDRMLLHTLINTETSLV